MPEEIINKKPNKLLTKILFGIIIAATLVSIYLTVKLVIAGFTFR